METTDSEINKKRVRVSNRKYLDSEPDELNNGKHHQRNKKLKKCVYEATRGPIPIPPPSPFEKDNKINSKSNEKSSSALRSTDFSVSLTAIVVQKKYSKLPDKGISCYLINTSKFLNYCCYIATYVLESIIIDLYISFLDFQQQPLDIDNIEEEKMDYDDNNGLIQENGNAAEERANGIHTATIFHFQLKHLLLLFC